MKLSGQGSVYTRCLEPFEEEDRDEDDEQPIIPSFISQCAGDLSETPVNASSSSLQHQNSEAESTAPGKLLIFGDTMLFSSEMENNQSVNNY